MADPVIIGDCTLYLGDAAEILPSLKFEAVLTDPPYGIGAARREFYGTKKRRASFAAPINYGDAAWDDQPPPPEIIRSLTTCPCIIWGGNFFHLDGPSRWLVWDKINDGMAFADCEIAWTNTSGAIRIFRHQWAGFIRGSEKGVTRDHPTQKPVELMKWCLSFLPESRSICDPFFGSGTTAIACVKTGHSFVGCEIDPAYFDIAVRRISDAVSRPDLFIETSKPLQPSTPSLFNEAAE